MTPTVSVIIPTFNRSLLLERAIRSVLSQIYRSFEIIIIDDASTDNTKEVLEEKFNHEISVGMLKYFKNETKLERSRSRNKGMDLAKGEYFAFLDDDDFWLPEHLNILCNYLDTNPDVGIVFSNFILLNEDSAIIPVKIRDNIKSGKGDYYKDLCITRIMANNSTHLFRRSVYSKLGGINNHIEFGEDREFFSRIAMNYNIGYIASVTSCIYTHSGSYSSKKTMKEHSYIKEQVWKLIEKNSELYSYPIKNKIRAEAYIFLSQYFLPDIAKAKEYLIKAIKTDCSYFFRVNTLGLLLRVIWGQHIYLIFKKMNNAK